MTSVLAPRESIAPSTRSRPTGRRSRSRGKGPWGPLSTPATPIPALQPRQAGWTLGSPVPKGRVGLWVGRGCPAPSVPRGLEEPQQDTLAAPAGPGGWTRVRRASVRECRTHFLLEPAVAAAAATTPVKDAPDADTAGPPGGPVWLCSNGRPPRRAVLGRPTPRGARTAGAVYRRRTREAPPGAGAAWAAPRPAGGRCPPRAAQPAPGLRGSTHGRPVMRDQALLHLQQGLRGASPSLPTHTNAGWTLSTVYSIYKHHFVHCN